MNPSDAVFCNRCATSLLGAVEPEGSTSTFSTLSGHVPESPYVEPEDPLYDPVVEAFERSHGTPDLRLATARSRTEIGLWCMMVGFALSWIPLINDIGFFFTVAGVVLLFLGRKAYSKLHHRLLLIGCALLLVSILGTIVSGLTFGSEIVAQSQSRGTTSAQLATAILQDLRGFLLEVAFFAVLSLLAQVLLVYGLSSTWSRLHLWMTFAMSLMFQVVLLGFAFSELDVAVLPVTLGTPASSSTLESLSMGILLEMIVGAFIAFLWVLAYRRVRKELRARRSVQHRYCPQCRSKELTSLGVLMSGPPYFCGNCGYSGLDFVAPPPRSGTPIIPPSDPLAQSPPG